MTVETVSLRQELEDYRAATASARVSEEAGRLQLARMMDDQLAQNQAIENLLRQVESSNTAVREAQAALRLNQDQQLQQQRMPPPTRDWWCHQPYSLYAILFNSIDWDAHKRAPWGKLLPCWFTGGPRLCRTDACHVWLKGGGST